MTDPNAKPPPPPGSLAEDPPTVGPDILEETTPQDLAAQANVGFALDLEDVMPGAAVGAETLLAHNEPDVARRLGLTDGPRPTLTAGAPPAPAWTPPAAPLPSSPPASPAWEPAPPAAAAPSDAAGAADEPAGPDAQVLDEHEPDTPEDLAARALVGFALDLLDAPAAPPEAAEAPLAAAAPEEPLASPVTPSLVWQAQADLADVTSPLPDVPAGPPTAAPAAAPLSRAPSPTHASTHLATGHRQYPAAWAWAGLGAAPVMGRGARPSAGRRVAAEAPTAAGGGGLSAADEVLELAAVGKGTDGVTEMLLVFKDDVWAGVTCKLRMEPGGVRAVFVAPDDSARRTVDGMADEMLARMRRRGLRVGGYSVEVAR